MLIKFKINSEEKIKVKCTGLTTNGLYCFNRQCIVYIEVITTKL